MLLNYFIVGMRRHETLKKENTFFNALLIGNDNISATGFNIKDTGRDKFVLSNILLEIGNKISFDKKYLYHTESLYFNLLFNQKTNSYIGEWQSQNGAEVKKGKAEICLFEVYSDSNFSIFFN